MREYSDELAELEALHVSIVYRDKTTEQKACEGELWLEIETEKARLRQAEAAKCGICSLMGPL